MNFNVLHNFISPVTGRILVDTDYIIVGNDNGIGDPSPILIDIQLDLINLRVDYNILRKATFIIREPNDEADGAQVLSELESDPNEANILKVIEHGYIAIATPRVDYVTPPQLQEVKDQIGFLANSTSEFVLTVAEFADASAVFADAIAVYAGLIGQEEIVAAAGIVTTTAAEVSATAATLAIVAEEVAQSMEP